MRLEKRLRALEAQFISEPAILYFADDTAKEICGRSDFLLSLLVDTCRGAPLNARQAEAMDLIRRSVFAKQPDGGRLTELIRLAANGPQERDLNNADL